MNNKKGKTVLTVVTFAAVLFALSATAKAATIVEEQFIYEPLPVNINGQNGGTGFNGPWVSTKSHGRDYQSGITVFAAGAGTTLNSDGGLFLTGGPPVAGAALSRYGTAGRAQAHRLLSDTSRTSLTGDNTTMWFSVLASCSASYRQGTFLFGTYHFSTQGTPMLGDGDEDRNPPFVPVNGQGFGLTFRTSAGTDGDGTINALAFNNSSIATIVAGTFTQPLQSGATHHDTSMVVGKINWKPNGTPDELFLFNVTAPFTTEPPESAAIASITNLDFDQSNFNTVAMWDGSTSIFDEIRFGNTFADVGGIPRYAWNPTPADGAECVNGYVWLFWNQGLGAVEHDVYFGISFDDVNNATASEPPVDPYKGRQSDSFYEVSVLVPGTTYYWRIDEVNDLDPGSPYKGQVWSFWLRPWEPTNPSPSDGATLVWTDADLSWSAGFQATQHEVFFGTDPCSLASIYLSAATTCDPGPLLKDTTYYWQVKEYQPGGRRTLGPIWSFSTVPYIPITDPNLVGWWKLDGNDIDSSGYDHHGIENGNPEYVTGYDGQAIEFDRVDDYIDCGNPPMLNMLDKLTAATWVKGPFTRGWECFVTKRGEGDGWKLRRYGSSNNACFTIRDTSGPDDPQGSVNINDGEWHHVAGTWDGAIRSLYVDGQLDRADADTGTMVATVDENVIIGAWMAGPGDVRDPAGITLDDIRIYNKALSDKEIKIMVGLFAAINPNPYDTETIVLTTPTLTWTPGVYVADTGGSHVFFSSDKAEVEDRSETVRTIVDGNSLSVGTLDYGTTYYWAVDTVNDVGPDPCMWEGNIWSFTVAEYLVVDDMEDYNDRTAITTVWRDGYTGGPVGNSGSNVTVSTESDPRDPRLTGDGPPWPVRDSEAMQFAYDNDGSVTIYVQPYDPYTYSVDANYYSEAKAAIANLPIGTTNWAEGGFKALTLWFYGDAGNAIEPMWVKLTDQGDISGKVAYGSYGEDPNDLKDPSWHEWNIAMSDFGVDLTQVKDISIGFGDESNRTTPGGSGVVFFDDIRLYTPRCILSLRSPDFARADYVEDCVVDNKELELMAKNWLGAVPEMIPITISDAGFDDYVLTEGGYIDIADPLYAALDAWKCHSGDAWIDYGYWRADGYPEDLYALSGNNKAYGYEDYIYQILDETFIEGQTYTLSVWTGQPWGGDIRWSLYFTGEDYTNNLTEASGDSPLDWGQVKLVYTATASDAGNKIGIKMYGDSDVSFEDVTLFRSSAPLTDDPQVNLYDDDIINFKDYSLIASKFLEEEMFP